VKRKLFEGALLFFFASVFARLAITFAWYGFGVYLRLPNGFNSWTNLSIICSGSLVLAAAIMLYGNRLPKLLPRTALGKLVLTALVVLGIIASVMFWLYRSSEPNLVQEYEQTK
jgi:hypothetical protein